jgi:hypothetical protein
VTRQHTNKQRISRRPRIHLDLVVARALVMLLAGCTVLAACTSGPAEQYYSPAGDLAVRGNHAIRAAWDTAVQASQDGLSAGLAPQTAAWDRGVTRGAFATMMCPAWMLHQIAALAGPLGSGGWNVTAAPGGAGNSGGFYLALPKAGRHQQAAFGLASFLTGKQAGADLFRTQGDFPANFAAVTAVESVTSGYFSGARLDREVPRRHPAQLVHQHLPVHPALVHRRPAMVEGPGLPERRIRPGLQLPPVLGRSRYRHRLRVVRAAVPDGATAIRLLGRQPISK